jgi:histidine kinase/DNA gyrase B/HSP90-like ATPase
LSRRAKIGKGGQRGKLRIGDDWNAIRIIARSQSNPLEAIAEFVENSIDARAKTVTITRGGDHGEHYLSIRDDGTGVPRDAEGLPDFKYVATHICDSIKRRLKADGDAARCSPSTDGDARCGAPAATQTTRGRWSAVAISPRLRLAGNRNRKLSSKNSTAAR